MEPIAGRKVAFVCKVCGESIGDPVYRGPAGHAPPDVCFTCWVNAFEQPPWHWPREVLAVWLIANGYSRRAAAKLAGLARSTLWTLLGRLAKNSSELVEFFKHFSELCVIRRLKTGRRAR
jgi:DNA-binding CsgD family transcriptional regulator